MERLELCLLGRFEVRVDGLTVPVEAWASGRARELVKLLALSPGHRLPRDRVLEDFWPSLAPDAALANLHKAAHHGRRALEDAGGVVLQGGLVALAPGARIETDVERFEAAHDPDLYGGDLLPDDPYASWAEQPRAALRGRYLEALFRAGRWEALADAEPADEAAQREVMRARFAAGDRLGALRAFDRLSDGLAAIGAEPGAETLALHARIAGGAAFDRALAAVELELTRAPVSERAGLLATRADLLLATASRAAPAAYADAAAAAGPEGMALRIRQAWAQLAIGDPGAARATLADFAPDPGPAQIPHLLARAAAAWFGGDVTEAGSAAAEAQRLAREAGLGRELRMAVQIQAMVAHSTGDWPRTVREVLDSTLTSSDLADTLFDGHMCVAEYALTSGEPLEHIRAGAEELHAAAVRSGARRGQVFAATLLGEIALVTGVIEEADTRLREAVRVAREIGAVSAEALASMRLGEATRAAGEPAGGDAFLGDALVISRWSPLSGHLLPLGYAALLRGSDERALVELRLDDAGALLREQPLVCAYCGTAFRLAASIAAAHAALPDQAAAYLAGAEAASALWPGGLFPAALDEARGELAWATGDEAEARSRLSGAGRVFVQAGRQLDADRIQARLDAIA
ncbi:MAG TPA: BTAD domain-containing putative transcriptional regulator [Gaiellaceae bacterium]|jgi:DNA-binding SARP family transcriptional activator|nr:BTAD domain-containing putative transcriptional regulator [Gaiellaceae bacterium]